MLVGLVEAVGHVDEGELRPAALLSMGDLAEARESGDSLILDYRGVIYRRLPGCPSGFLD
jgi:hypothetical protein